MNRQSCFYVRLRILAGVVFAATLAACGGSDDSSPELVSAAPTPMPAAAATSAEGPRSAQHWPAPTLR
jgi:hypothetical protein